ncbi:HNH endonuclease signature motif containing protein [Williamsia soli]|uniref:HNH endonuclease signature motif containing protein n=1 Tax=Williamsia soli TaxID=364929 RepID=UPI001A9CDD39|nr:HNH endonuclease signature motif containing protein [Williamsia soli]
MSESGGLLNVIQHMDAAELVVAREAISQRLTQVPLTTLSDEQVVETAQVVETGRRREDALSVRWALELRERGAAAKRGLKPGKYLSSLLRLNVDHAGARYKAAERVGYRRELSGDLLPAPYPATAAALTDGAIEFAHYRIIHKTLKALPHVLRGPEMWSRVEADLAAYARTMSPEDLTKAAQRLIAYLNPDGEFTDDADRARTRAFNVSRPGIDHMSGISGNLTPATRALWDALAEKWARQGMNNPADPQSPSGNGDLADQEALAAAAERDDRTQDQRNHDAFHRMLEHVVGSRAVGQHRGHAAKVVVTMTLDELEKETGIATTASGGTLPVRDALALAGSSRKFLALLDNAHRPLFLGREARLASADQRIALIAAERGCSRPGCDQPATRTAVHHMREWRNGGYTDITVLTLVCDPDHGRIHDGEHGWITELITSETGPPEWVGRVGWRQRGTDDPLTPNDTHFPERHFQETVAALRAQSEAEEAHAAWFRQRAKEELFEANWQIEHPDWHAEEQRWIAEVEQLPDPEPPPSDWFSDAA